MTSEEARPYQQLSAVQHDTAASRAQVLSAGQDGECRAIEASWRAWKAENVAAIEKELAASRDDPFMRYLIDGRNALFRERIRLHLREKGSMFVALWAPCTSTVRTACWPVSRRTAIRSNWLP